MKIHHLGVVTTDVASTLSALGLSAELITEVVEDDNQKNRLHFIYLEANDMWLELVEPMEQKSSVFKFAKKKRVGLHHLAFSGADLPELRRDLGEIPGMFPLGTYQINVKSFGGQIRTLFVAFHGLILEYVEVVRR
jgi:hypothetical protein